MHVCHILLGLFLFCFLCAASCIQTVSGCVSNTSPRLTPPIPTCVLTFTGLLLGMLQ